MMKPYWLLPQPSLSPNGRRRRRNAMLHLRKLLPPFLPTSHLHSRSLSPLFPLHRLLAATTARSSPEPFAVEDYLVTACGLTRPKARKTAHKISHLKSPAKIDAVLAFLSSLGISRPSAAAIVAGDPQLLCADVENNLAKRVVELTGLGLRRSQIARLIPLAHSFRHSSFAPNLAFWLPVFGSFDRLVRALKVNGGLLGADLEKVAKPNLALLQQCGVDVGRFSGTYVSRVLSRLPEHVQNAVSYIDKLGVPRSSPMFRYALMAFAVQSQERHDKKMRILETLGWSHDDVLLAVRKMPGILTVSEDRLRRNVEFLMRDVGLEAPYIAQRPVLVMYSLERRLLPRHSLLNVLNAKGLLHPELDFYTVAALTDQKFLDKYVHPYETSVPGLAMTYASYCAGKVLDGVST